MSSSSSPPGVMSISVCGCMLDMMEVYCSFNGMNAGSSVPGCLGVMTELMCCALSEYDTVAKTSVMSSTSEESEGSTSEEEGGVFRLTPARGRRFPAVHLLPSSETFLQIFAMHITTERDQWPAQPAHFRSFRDRETWLRANALPVETHRFTFYNCFHATTVEIRRNFSLVASDSYRNVPRFDCALIHSDTAVPLVAQILAWFRYSDGPNTFSGAFVQEEEP